jgi:hypothetical protein
VRHSVASHRAFSSPTFPPQIVTDAVCGRSVASGSE